MAGSNCCSDTTGVKGLTRARRGDLDFWGQKLEGEALRHMINKLSDERNLKDLHLKHMSTAQFKNRTTHLDIPGKIYDLYQHVVCNSIKARPERSRVRGLRAEEFGHLISLDHGSAMIGDKNLGLLFIFGWSHVTFDNLSMQQYFYIGSHC